MSAHSVHGPASGADNPFAIVDGSIAAAGGRKPVGHRLREVPMVGRVLGHRSVQHLAAAVRLSALVRERRHFLGNELRSASGCRAYTLRRSGRTVLLRHDRVDIWTFNEVFLLGVYRPPAVIAARLAKVGAPEVLDIGANIGLFGIDALARYPEARITGWEPDPENAAVHRAHIARNRDIAGRWTLREACAGVAEGTVAFLWGQETASHIVPVGTPGAVDVPVDDVLARFASVDLVKIDIEGGEWELLADPRFAAAATVVLEYHPDGCRADDPHAEVRRLLDGHGLTVIPLFEHPGGFGMLWAYRA